MVLFLYAADFEGLPPKVRERIDEEFGLLRL